MDNMVAVDLKYKHTLVNNHHKTKFSGTGVLTTYNVLLEISRILNTGLDMETLSICVRLCEQGINPEALSSVIKELRKATEALKAAENMTS
ncbi:mitotic-spindle organizing protein 1 [Carlito syrichta]|uniref:Mitotic-spindle organizing protein 1 n=1 Tax=Carlito syrichta TaxID=1868482 RepID=A0A1U7T8N2_CARSF|nr:mitotic-spindle organizing protein 1 [Carlito syrichta]